MFLAPILALTPTLLLTLSLALLLLLVLSLALALLRFSRLRRSSNQCQRRCRSPSHNPERTDFVSGNFARVLLRT